MSHRSRDIDCSDDQYAKTVVLDPISTVRPSDEDATVVLDLTPAQVQQILTDGKTPAKK